MGAEGVRKMFSLYNQEKQAGKEPRYEMPAIATP
jgi:hypothetical protein